MYIYSFLICEVFPTSILKTIPLSYCRFCNCTMSLRASRGCLGNVKSLWRVKSFGFIRTLNVAVVVGSTVRSLWFVRVCQVRGFPWLGSDPGHGHMGNQVVPRGPVTLTAHLRFNLVLVALLFCPFGDCRVPVCTYALLLGTVRAQGLEDQRLFIGIAWI